MTTIPLLGIGAETPVEGQPLLLNAGTADVVTDEMGRSNLRRNLDSLGRDFYCRCICDPLRKMFKMVPMSAVKVGLLCTTAVAILVCLTILEVVGAHRQSELQHALNQRLRNRNLSAQTLEWMAQQQEAGSAVIGQYGQRVLAPYVHLDAVVMDARNATGALGAGGGAAAGGGAGGAAGTAAGTVNVTDAGAGAGTGHGDGTGGVGAAGGGAVAATGGGSGSGAGGGVVAAGRNGTKVAAKGFRILNLMTIVEQQNQNEAATERRETPASNTTEGGHFRRKLLRDSLT